MLGGLKKCAKCDKQVYTIEELKCLDKIWHKNCFKCTVCNSILNMKNYKGFDKQPYCVVHYPQQKHTAVSDNPEMLRIKENTKIQSNAKYHEDFEKSKGNYTVVADDPETRRILENTKIFSQVKYHEDFEKNIKNKYTAVLDNPETQRAIENQKLISSAEYKNVKNQSPQNQPAIMNNNNGNGNNFNVNGGHHANVGYVANVGSLPRSVNIYDAAVSGAVISKSNSSSATSAKASVEENQFNDYNQHQQQQQRRIGSIADYDPLNYESQLVNNFNRQSISSTSSSSNSATNIYNGNGNGSSSNGAVVTKMAAINGYHQQIAQHHQHQQHQYNQQQQHQQHLYHQQQQLPANFNNLLNSEIMTTVYKAIYDYDAKEDDEISFRDGDKFINCERIDVGWMIGVHEKTGKHGMFPSNYAEPVDLF